LKAWALDCTQWRTRFGRDYGLGYEPNENDIVPYKVRRVSFESFDDSKMFSCSPLQRT